MILILILKRGTNLLLIFSFFTYELWYSTGWLFRAWLHYLVLLIVRRFRFTCYISNALLAWRCLVLLSVAQHCSVLLSIAQCCSALLSVARQCSALLSAALCCALLHSIARCCMLLHSIARCHSLALIGIAQHEKNVITLKYHYFNMTHLVLNFFLNAYHSKRMKLFKGLIYSTKIFMLQ